MNAELREEHEWHKKMVGAWTITGECMMSAVLYNVVADPKSLACPSFYWLTTIKN
jgi:hypothetical protein